MDDDTILTPWESDIARNFLRKLDAESPVWSTSEQSWQHLEWRTARRRYVTGEDDLLAVMLGKVDGDCPSLAEFPKPRCPKLRQAPARIGYFGAGWIALLVYVALSIIFLR